MTTIEVVEKKAQEYSKLRVTLAAEVTQLNDEITILKRKRLSRIRYKLNRVQEAHKDLIDIIDDNRDLFRKPRSKTFHGIKLGLKKNKGKICFEDPDKVVALIKKKIPEQRDLLITTKETPCKDALNNLKVDELKKLGCTVTQDNDAVFVKVTDSDIDKLVESMLDVDEEESE